jgi:ankyrin repeat protein
MRTPVLLASWVAIMLPATAAHNSVDLFQAIRNGDTAFLRAHLTKTELEARDSRGATPVMHAAAFGNLDALKLLLDAGADVNARNNFDATALLWAARDPDKAKLLIERGADVNVRSKLGRTPLMVAALRKGGSAIVALMLAKGADVYAKDSRDTTALGLAASVGDAETMRLLLAKGADPNAVGINGSRPISAAAIGREPDAARLLIEKGVDVNAASTTAARVKNGQINLTKLTALHLAAIGPVETLRQLLAAGANVNARDGRSLTPLFFALATDYPSTEMVLTLLQAGADVDVHDDTGETPLDWAEKFGNPEVLAALKKAGAKRGISYDPPKLPDVQRPEPAVALTRSLQLLETSSAEYFKQSGCVGCHHQPLIARAQSLAKRAGVSIDETAAKQQLMQLKTLGIGLSEEYLQAITPGGGTNRITDILIALRASNYPPDTITDTAVAAIAASQEPNGRWGTGEVQARPPITASDIAATARAIRALREYPIPARSQEFRNRIARAQEWLKQERPISTGDFSMRLSGLTQSGARDHDVRSAAKALLALQRSDGGWGASPHLKSDAYVTGGALVALAESRIINVKDGAYRRGIDYLLSTQFPDGSWHVRSRAIKFQPYFESGFPFGHDQWISAAATAWAGQAIALSLEPATVTSARR